MCELPAPGDQPGQNRPGLEQVLGPFVLMSKHDGRARWQDHRPRTLVGRYARTYGLGRRGRRGQVGTYCVYFARPGWPCSRSPICARGGTFQARTVHDARCRAVRSIRTWAPHGRSHPSQARRGLMRQRCRLQVPCCGSVLRARRRCGRVKEQGRPGTSSAWPRNPLDAMCHSLLDGNGPRTNLFFHKERLWHEPRLQVWAPR